MRNARRPSLPARLATVLLICCSLFLGGCTSAFDGILQSLGLLEADYSSPDSMAEDAMGYYNHGKYSKAFSIFEKLRDRYPFSQYSMLAGLKMADCKYYDGAYDEAAVLYEEFENNHPNNEAIPYVMFQLGMCHFQQLDTIDRDPGSAQSAIQAFTKLLKAVPVSPYTEEAKARVAASRDFLAMHEFFVADFYIRTGENKQAEGRLDYLITTYPESATTPAAKQLLAALRSDNPPQRSWKSWLPEVSVPTWKSVTDSLSFSKNSGDKQK